MAWAEMNLSNTIAESEPTLLLMKWDTIVIANVQSTDFLLLWDKIRLSGRQKSNNIYILQNFSWAMNCD